MAHDQEVQTLALYTVSDNASYYIKEKLKINEAHQELIKKIILFYFII
jgi:hypothetical protein